jgi:predicted nucleic acid-binding protein
LNPPKLKFISEEIIPLETWLASEELTKDIDINDIDFVALTKFLNATLWTGDKVLYNGLKKLDFKNILNTKDFLALRMAKNQN